MNKNKIYRIAGLFLIIASLLFLIIADLTKLMAILAGVFLGLGIGLLSAGDSVFYFWINYYREFIKNRK